MIIDTNDKSALPAVVQKADMTGHRPPTSEERREAILACARQLRFYATVQPNGTISLADNSPDGTATAVTGSP